MQRKDPGVSAPHFHFATLGARDVLAIRPEGPLDFERSRDALEALVRHRGFGAAEALLLDLREATCALDVTDLVGLALHVAGLEAGRGRKVAVVWPAASNAEPAPLAAQCARRWGARLHLFETIGEARAWLNPMASPHSFND